MRRHSYGLRRMALGALGHCIEKKSNVLEDVIVERYHVVLLLFLTMVPTTLNPSGAQFDTPSHLCGCEQKALSPSKGFPEFLTPKHGILQDEILTQRGPVMSAQDGVVLDSEERVDLAAPGASGKGKKVCLITERAVG